MGFSFGNAIAAVTDEPTRACLTRLGRAVHESSSTLSTFTRNNTQVAPPPALVVSGVGSVNALAKFVSTGSVVGSSSITDDGATLDLGPAITTTNIYGNTTITEPDIVDHAGALVGVGFQIFEYGDIYIKAGSSLGPSNPNGAHLYLLSGDTAGFGGRGGVYIRQGDINGVTSVVLNDGNITFGSDDPGVPGTGTYYFLNPRWSAIGGLFPNYGILNFNLSTANRTYTFPNTTGTVLLSTTGFANPSVSIGLSATNGTATTAMTSDSAPALSQSIVPTWTGLHTFNGKIVNRSTSATQFITGYDSSNQMSWDTTSAGDTTATILMTPAAGRTGLTLQPAVNTGTTLNNGASTFRVLDLAGRQRFWIGRAAAAATNTAARIGFDSSNYLEINNSGAAPAQVIFSVVGATGITFSPALVLNSTVAHSGLDTFNAGATFAVGATAFTIAPDFNGGAGLNSGVYTLATGTSDFTGAAIMRATPSTTFPGRTTTGAAAWPQNTAVTAGTSFCSNDSNKQYRCITSGTTQNTPAAGPTGTSEDITDGTAHWKFIGLIHADTARYNHFIYNIPGAGGTDSNGVGGGDGEFISIRGYNTKDGGITRQDTTEYALYEQLTWGWTNSNFERAGEWFIGHLTPAGNQWHPWEGVFDKLGTENPVAAITLNTSRTTIGFQANSNGFAVNGAQNGYGALEVYGGNIYHRGSIQFEGSTVDLTTYTMFGVIDPTGANTINLPNTSGTVVVAPAGLTPFNQTAYSTASHTHPALTATSVATTAATLVAYGYTQAQADSIPVAINALLSDLTDLKKLVNALIDDGQLSGAFA